MSITLIPEVSKTRRNTSSKQWARAIEPGTGRSWWIEVLDSQSAVAQAHGLAVGMGADALVEFAIDEVMVDNGGMEVPTLEVSGFAIKRR